MDPLYEVLETLDQLEERKKLYEFLLHSYDEITELQYEEVENILYEIEEDRQFYKRVLNNLIINKKVV